MFSQHASWHVVYSWQRYFDQTNCEAPPGIFYDSFFSSGVKGLQHENYYRFCIMARLRMYGAYPPYIFVARCIQRQHYACANLRQYRFLIQSCICSIAVCLLMGVQAFDYSVILLKVTQKWKFSKGL
jgi:hypothetical protein